MADKDLIINVRRPGYLTSTHDWSTWRDTFHGGEYYRDHYLLKFGDRETEQEFQERLQITPIPTFAKSAILDVRNSIYQRLVEVSRVGGSKAYQDAINGEGGGVDGSGLSMDAFIGKEVLTELLIMGHVGIYVDAAPPEGDSLADPTYPPYLSMYAPEDILSYSRFSRAQGGEFSAVLLRDYHTEVTQVAAPSVSLPSDVQIRYRLVWKDPEDGEVYYKLFDDAGEIVHPEDAREDGAVRTGLKRVPFILLDIGDSLLADVASYQAALLNLSSNDVYYAIKSNSPFLAIQRDAYGSGSHLKRPESDTDEGHDETMGGGKGRYYGINEDAPQFISPPTDPLEASMKLQTKLEDSIRSLVNLAVANKQGTRTESGTAKKMSEQGLENGLAFIGMVLESGEKKVAQTWAEYENVVNPVPAVISYPDRYTLKTDEERFEEAEKQLDLAKRLPGKALKRAMAIRIARTLLEGKVTNESMEEITSEIRNADNLLVATETILEAHKAGLVDDATASTSLGFASGLVEQAREDRAIRIRQTLEAQTPRDGSVPNAAARGAPELDTNPNSGSEEREGNDS